MLPQLHHHVLSELDRSARADTVFVFGAVVLDVVSIAANSALAAAGTPTTDAVFWLFMVGVLFVTVIAAWALRNGASGCEAYHAALMAMYAKEGVAEYFPAQAMRTGLMRYRLYFALVCILGAIALAVPLIVKLGTAGE
jgi:hypothetical protein